jgi:outer membrane receptor protein involved in Fe transport
MTALRYALLGGICLGAFHSTAMAQSAPPTGADAPTEEREIVVTGSRILRRDFIAESPITTVDQAFIQDSGPATVEQTLNALPQFQASQNAQTSSISTFGAGASGARSNANLRGLGPSRTLVLFDGRRLQPSDVLGTIDLNTIAPALIGSAEVITGGASAVYGSDAIAGVVNFRFNDRFRGLELQGEMGVSELGDANNRSASITYGGSVADDRARVFLSASYLGRGTASRDARSFFDNRLGTATPSNGLIVLEGANRFGGGSAAAVAAYRNLFLNTYGTAVPAAASSLLLNPDGTLIGNTGAINLRPDPITGYVIGATGTVTQRALRDSTLQLPLDRYSGFARAEFEISDNATLYAQAMYTWYQSDQVSDAGVTQSVVDPIRIRADNPFVTPDLRIALNSRPNPAGSFVYYFNTSRIGLLQVQQEYEVAQGMVGLKGRVGSSSLRYDVYASFGRTREDERAINSVSRSRLNAVLNGVGPTGLADGGRSVCSGGYNPFAFGPVSPECADYLTIDTVNRYRFEQTVVQANLTGDLFDLPGGSAAFAVGAEYRSNSYRADIDPRNSPTPTATPGVTTSPEALGTSGAFSSRGDINVRELYGELALPLLRDRAFFENLDLSLAYRFSDYNRIGGTHTYKASGNWSPFQGVSVRGGYSRAIRAPSLGELFSPLSGATGVIGLASSGAGDPCDSTGFARTGKIAGVDPAKVAALCVATGVPAATLATYRYSGTANAAQRIGNLNLKEETADSYTVGLVVEPSFAKPLFRALSFSVDYYDIRLKDAIGYVTSPIALNQCFNFGGLNPNYEASNFYCQLITRDSSGVLATIREPLFNLGAYRTSGIDFQANAAIGIGGVGTLLLNSSITYVIDYKIQNLSTEPFNDYAGTIGNSQIDGFSSTHPDWKHVTSASLSGRNGSLTLRWRFIGAQTNSSNVGNPTGTAPGVPAVSYFDLIGRVRANDAFELRGGITNLTNKQPPEFGGPSSTATSAYDIIGRRYFVGVTARF